MGNKISKKEKARREAEAKKKADKKNNMSFIFMCVAMVAVMWVVGYFFNGAEINDKPLKKEIVSVEIVNTKFSDEVKIYDDEDGIKLAYTILDLMRYRYGELETVPPEPYFTATYHMQDGTERVLQLADGVMFWNGEAKKLVREKMMLEMVNSVFFPEFVETEEK